MSEDDNMARLDARLARLKAMQEEDKPHVEEHYSQAHLGWRMVIELVTGLLIGFGIGFGLDSLFGTLPIFLILFTLLGLAAGIRVMMQSAAEIQNAQHAAPEASSTGTAAQDEDGKEG